MSQSLASILVHVVFSTKDRKPFITPDIEARLHQYMIGVCNNLDSPVLYIGGMPDHVHILLFVSRNIALSDLLSKLKANSSKWGKTVDPKYSRFQW